ncbi:hypothetical protein AB0D60_02015 [Streptomyces sp. NPDC048306]|uniref:hypothetical protein n=1 Tax=Streptomyces sp. NPDC048306 TaxID=3154502 RepID=UPI0033F22D71
MSNAFDLDFNVLRYAPPHWERRPLWTLVRRRDITGRPEAELLSVYRDHGVVPRKSREDNFNKPSEDLTAYRYVRPGDLVLNKMKTWQGSLGVSRHEGIVSPAYFVCEMSPDVDAGYAHHLLRSEPYIHLYRTASKGIRPNQWDLPFDEFRKLPMLLPPRDEQRRIADFLDHETAKLTRIEFDSLRLTGLLEERQSALAAHCFTFARPDDAHSLPLRRVVQRWIDYRGATPSKTESGVPLVTAKNIRDGRIDLDASREYIATDAYTDWMRRGLLKMKDVLLTTEAPLGQVAMVNDTTIALAQRVIVLRADQVTCSPEWLYWYLRSPQGQAELELRATGSTALGIKADRLRGVPIPLPSPREAVRRLSRLSESVAEVETLQRQLVKQRALVAERRRALITAAVTGQFDVATASGRNVTEGVTA